MHNHFQDRNPQLRPSEKVFSIIMQRLSKWVFNRYDCQIAHVFFKPDHARHEILKSLLQKNSFVRMDGTLNFPVFFAGEIVGAVTATEKEAELTLSQQKELFELFSMVIEPTLKDVEQIEMADRTIEHLSYVKERENLFKLNELKSKRLQPEIAEKPAPKVRFQLPCLIESEDLEEARKMAFEVHSQSDRYAFVSIDDLDNECLANPQQFAEAGSMSLFVPDVSKLKPFQVQFLHEFLNTTDRPQSSPKVIACTTQLNSLKAMASQQLYEVLELISVAQLRMDRPFKDYEKKDMLNLLFAALTERSEPHWIDLEIPH